MNDSTMVVLGATSFALVVVLYVWLALALAALFRKVGEPAWKAWVPFLNVATVLKLGGFSPWLILLNLVPIFGGIAFIAVFIVAVHRINTGFGAGAGLTVVGALFPVIWASILGFGSARWHGGAPYEPPRRELRSRSSRQGLRRSVRPPHRRMDPGTGPLGSRPECRGSLRAARAGVRPCHPPLRRSLAVAHRRGSLGERLGPAGSRPRTRGGAPSRRG
ncbi:DUF5684 domain-containing protein [Microbacterium sp. SL62]|uniref:DUF5684 domain-containing protein n=1 Tax=Microbacterium sp. SL62 TaxID=2995139 RepID=UPI002272A714|nr:DUF5684 domain-containing protein [Microbacterium sp. SL62]MCY1716261.1 DUF5684 domain-containing protein [Microbacterium sp. SL62]